MIHISFVDIDFTVVFRSSTPGSTEVVVAATQRTGCVGLKGTFNATECGELKLQFSNYFSWLTSKTVNFSVSRKGEVAAKE